MGEIRLDNVAEHAGQIGKLGFNPEKDREELRKRMNEGASRIQRVVESSQKERERKSRMALWVGIIGALASIAGLLIGLIRS